MTKSLHSLLSWLCWNAFLWYASKLTALEVVHPMAIVIRIKNRYQYPIGNIDTHFSTSIAILWQQAFWQHRYNIEMLVFLHGYVPTQWPVSFSVHNVYQTHVLMLAVFGHSDAVTSWPRPANAVWTLRQTVFTSLYSNIQHINMLY